MVTTPSQKISFAEYLSYDDGTNKRYELVDGQLIEMSPASFLHSDIIDFITDDFLNKLEIPESLQIEALKKAKEGYVMALLEAGQISSGRASRILKVSRLEVLEMMGKWGISVFDDSQNLEELSQEVEQAQWLLAQQNS